LAELGDRQIQALPIVDEHPLVGLERHFDLVGANIFSDITDTELGMGEDLHLLEVVAERVRPRLLLGFGHHLFPSGLGLYLFARFGRLRFGFFHAGRLAEGVNVAAGITLHATDLVLVFGNDDVRGVGLALRAVRFHLGPDIVYVVVEDEVLHPRWPLLTP
jgi:hypothetical protein